MKLLCINGSVVGKKSIAIIIFLLLIIFLYPFSIAETSDIDLIKKKGHPTYYGSTAQAHAVWDGVDSRKILFADQFSEYEKGETIITMDAYRDENYEIIRDLEVYFMNCTPHVDISLDEALMISDSYVPKDILHQWYEFSDSYYIPAEDTDRQSNYIVSYHLTEAGKSGFFSEKHPYSGTMDIILYVNPNGYVDYFTIGFGKPRSMPSTGSAWAYDFLAQ